MEARERELTYWGEVLGRARDEIVKLREALKRERLAHEALKAWLRDGNGRVDQ